MGITLLDGSVGQELVHRHGAAPTPLWSTSVMLENPDLVRQVHEDYFAIGAQIATINSYTLIPERLARNGMGEHLETLARTAMKQAVKARDRHGSGQVAGSLGPLGASYRTDFNHGIKDAETEYEQLITMLDEGVDFFLAETVSSLNQVKNLVHVTRKYTDKTTWLSVSVDEKDGSKLRSGEDLAEVKKLLEPHIAAVMVNCSPPEVIETALHTVKKFDRPYGANANGFTHISKEFLKHNPTVDALKARKDLGPVAYADFAQTWVDQGATLIGGCCEIGPAHIAELNRRFF